MTAFPASFPHFCAWCNVIFNADKLGQKYCSAECYKCAGRSLRQDGRSASQLPNPNEGLRAKP